MSSRYDPRVRPDGRVQMSVTVDADLYHAAVLWARTWNMTLSEAIEKMLRERLA